MKLVILGAGGFARETIVLAKQVLDEGDIILGSLEAKRSSKGTLIEGVSILGSVNSWINTERNDNISVVCAIGNPKRKQKAIKELPNKISFATLVHPEVFLNDNIIIGEGSIICSGTKLTTNIIIGRHVIINLSCTIGHDVIIGDYCTISPGVHLSGGTIIEAEVEMGTGSVT
ncbi:MAG: transferase, partial [Firmicutes bacterium]|nr:transferase [Bacillota bacterium]